MFASNQRLLALGPSALAVVLCLALASIGAACADNPEDEPKPGGADASAGPSFTMTADAGDADGAADGGAGAGTAASPPVLACIGTACPAPYASCSHTPSFDCTTNLSNDVSNCGACGVSCEGYDPVNMVASCVQGQCQLDCKVVEGTPFSPARSFENCNGIIDDGCEVDLLGDAANCGSCGNHCGPGVACILGRCGCTPPLVACDGKCVNVKTDGDNCGTCGNVCNFMPPDKCDLTGKNAGYVCGDGTCGHLVCSGGFGDCNKDIFDCEHTDGCEVDFSKGDPSNCGACGVVCAAHQVCRDDGAGFGCRDTCEVMGLTTCGKAGCRDVLSDTNHCGSCNNVCPAPRANQETSCHKGMCELSCLPGWGDCNGDPYDGCEVDLSIHTANCGACGNRCDIGAGQPCIGGACLMVACDAGATK